MILVLPFADDTKQTIYKYIAWVFGFGALRLARGALISMCAVLLFLPAMYWIFDKVICATSKNFKVRK